MNTQTVSRTEEKSAQAAFVGHLYGLAKGAERGDGTARARLARLRRTLTGRTLTYNGLSEVGDQLPPDLRDPELDTYLLVAALFALNPSVSAGANESFGATLKKLRRELSAGAESLDRRFGALLDADTEELPYRLRQLSQQLKSRGLAPNYYRLLDDLLKWDLPSRSIQRNWARDYWT